MLDKQFKIIFSNMKVFCERLDQKGVDVEQIPDLVDYAYYDIFEKKKFLNKFIKKHGKIRRLDEDYSRINIVRESLEKVYLRSDVRNDDLSQCCSLLDEFRHAENLYLVFRDESKIKIKNLFSDINGGEEYGKTDRDNGCFLGSRRITF